MERQSHGLCVRQEACLIWPNMARVLSARLPFQATGTERITPKTSFLNGQSCANIEKARHSAMLGMHSFSIFVCESFLSRGLRRLRACAPKQRLWHLRASANGERNSACRFRCLCWQAREIIDRFSRAGSCFAGAVMAFPAIAFGHT